MMRRARHGGPRGRAATRDSEHRTLRPAQPVRSVRPIRHGLIRPTVGGLVLLAAAAGACFGGLLLDDRTLMDAAIALTVVFVIALVLTGLQWFGLLPIGDARLARQIEQRDSHGNVVARLRGDVPERRGWYVTVSTVARWVSPLGLVAARKVVPSDGQTLVLPDDDKRGESGIAAVDKRQVGSSQSDHSGGVRAYAPGDPLKLISWRHTAHRGELMTRESSRDVRTTALLVLNTVEVSEDQLDSAVAALLPWALAARNGRAERLVVTDGVQTFEGIDAVERFLAAVRPSGEVIVDGRSGRARSRASGSHHAHSEQQSAGDTAAPAARAAAIVRIAMNGQGPVRVLACDAAADQPLLGALRRTPIADRLTALDPSAPQSSPAYRHIDIAGDRAHASGGIAGIVPVGDVFRRREFADASALAQILALLAFFGVALTGVSGLIAPTGLWIWFAAALLAVAALETGVAERLAAGRTHPGRPNTRPVWRCLGYTVLTLIATVVLSVIRLRSVAGDALAHIAAQGTAAGQDGSGVSAGAAASSAASAASTAADGPFAALAARWQLFVSVVEDGFNQLNLQLPPLKVTPASDMFLILLVAALAILIRFVLAFRPVWPVMVVLPVAALAADYALVGHIAPLWAIGLVVVALPLALWAARPQRAVAEIRLPRAIRARTGAPAKASKTTKTTETTETDNKSPRSPEISQLARRPGFQRSGDSRPPLRRFTSRFAPLQSMAGGRASLALRATPVIAALLAAAITLPLTGPAADLAYRVPLSIGEGGGMFTSNTVNPMIDLKRNIAAGSDNTVFTYRAYRRLYLRLTTLDNFDGDSWGYDREFALDAGLYGSGIQLGRDSDDELTRRQRMVMNPLGAYMAALGYTGYDVALTNSASLEQFMVNADVRIASLKSRFLPVPGNVSYLDNGVGDDWLLYQDGTVYNRTTGTSPDIEYTAYGSALTPITGSSGFSQLTPVKAAESSLLDESDTTTDDMTAWYQARRNLADTGLAEIHGDSTNDFLVIKATLNADGSVVGPNGWRLGSGSFSGGGVMLLDGSQATVPTSVVFNDTVVKQFGFGKDDYVLGFGADGNVTIAVPLRDVSTQSSINGDDGEHVSEFYGANMWEGRVVGVLSGMNSGLSAYSMVKGSISESNPAAERMKRYVSISDERAHASRYTSVPKDLPANVRAVINQAQAAGVPITGDSYDNQVRVMRWLVEYFTNPDNGFTYSLNAPDGDGRDNLEVVDDFLDSETGHAGYCQHYASALAILGRAMGVPTRIVLGYNAGVEDRDANGYFTVKSKQLHAWVEAYMDGVGWVPFDVTPATVDNGSAKSDSASDSTDASGDSSSTSDGDQSSTETNQSDQNAQSDDAAGADESTNDDSADAADENGATDTSQDAASGATSAGVWRLTLPDIMTWPVWARVLLGLFALALAVGSVWGAPRLWRWMRRRRVLRAIARAEVSSDDGGLTDAAWQAVWHEVLNTARPAAKPSPADTDLEVAAGLAKRYPDQADFIRDAARNATAARFGGRPEPVTGLTGRFQTFLKRFPR
ncbi:transglutaminase [Bifidobacterium myosotis]|uniref:Transglutaminase n=1 Tax=Bifidobacterium myosotis TaxID=1630166 RepID=A0A261FR22_9BIFI|nr:transglutaminase [Bifidobacterium myosotis]